MIAITGYLKYINNDYADISITAQARLKVTE
jgi:N6-L-threonylcarbamoyladenine synthase